MGNNNNKLPNGWDYKKCQEPKSAHDIDPTKKYPNSYKEFMTQDCEWDYYGNTKAKWHFDDTLITEDQVE